MRLPIITWRPETRLLFKCLLLGGRSDDKTRGADDVFAKFLKPDLSRGEKNDDLNTVVMMPFLIFVGFIVGFSRVPRTTTYGLHTRLRIDFFKDQLRREHIRIRLFIGKRPEKRDNEKYK